MKKKIQSNCHQILTVFIILSVFLITGCSKPVPPGKEKQWRFYKEIKTGYAKPNGVVFLNGNLWISDTPNNRILKIDTSGNIIKEFDRFKRPMHISLFQNKIFVPEFLSDSIKIIDVKTGKISSIAGDVKPNAPAGVAVYNNDTAVADFYNHRIILKSNDNTITIGKEGHGNNEFYYPTDVSFSNGLLYVADAYNNRVQIFDRNGIFQKVIGRNDNIKTTLGIFVNEKYIFVTGFENNCILVYNKQSKLIQKIVDPHLNHPSDMHMSNEMLYVSNYGGNSIILFRR